MNTNVSANVANVRDVDSNTSKSSAETTSLDTQVESPMSAIACNRLLQLCSANLPVGGFSFSQGLEYAVEEQWVNGVETTHQWIKSNLLDAVATTDLALSKRLYRSLAQQDITQFKVWDQHVIACRESAELRLAEVAMGKALIRLLSNLNAINTDNVSELLQRKEISFVGAFTLAAYLFGLDQQSTLSGYCWTYIDNQVAAATKLVPLGQTQAQNLLFELTDFVQQAIHIADDTTDLNIGGSLPRLAMASAWHEEQYTRLFRS
ncbi:urease accessory protein UreF [Algibacillus agarilyticus]|uniref:urease accessory protein UreF n=1 Tax=Algibacillus agarilyticus TaxID=2234133 RepID=UPI001E31038C|nr:urease accessory UreF family protein [Algibacillus agarilyticus]